MGSHREENEDLKAYETAVASVRRRSMPAASVTRHREHRGTRGCGGPGQGTVPRAHVVLGTRPMVRGTAPRRSSRKRRARREVFLSRHVLTHLRRVGHIVVDDIASLPRRLRSRRTQRLRSSASRSVLGSPRAWLAGLYGERKLEGSPHACEVQIVHEAARRAKRSPRTPIYNERWWRPSSWRKWA